MARCRGGWPHPQRGGAGEHTRRYNAFTIIELLIVMAIIIVLAGLIIGTSGYVQKKGARSRAEAEIAAMSAALESYKADNGIYPTSAATESLVPTNIDSSIYKPASFFLYGELSGDRDGDGVADTPPVGGPPSKSYMQFKPAMMNRAKMSADVASGNPVNAIRDPFGAPYGYSTAKAANPGGTVGNNPTFDLWSTAGERELGEAAELYRQRWIKNW